MKKIFAVLALTLGLGSCGELVTIQSAEVAKQLNGSGFEEEVRSTGVSRLDVCSPFTKICPTIVKLSIGRNTNTIDIDSIYLPKSNVDVKQIKVGVQWRPRDDQKSINSIYNELASEKTDSWYVRYISVDRVWTNYGERIIPARIVDALKDMTVDQMMNTSSELSNVVKNSVDTALKNSPIEVTQLDIINTDVPQTVLDAKYRLFSIEDNKNRQVKELEVGVAIEQQRQALQVTRANNDKEIALKLGMTPALYMCLKNSEKMADAADNKGASVYVNGNCGLSSDSDNPVITTKNKSTEDTNANR